MKRNPFFSRVGCVTALIFIAAMIGATYALGGRLFSPGELSVQGADRSPLKNFKSHVDFEGQCEYCHAPWQGVTASLCESCHTQVADERRTSTGVHGVLKSTGNCQLCHVEHKGRTADQTAAAMISFPHEQTGYSLVKHQRWADGRALACRDCHDPRAASYAFQPQWCATCHRQIDAAYIDRHVAKYSADCLACHHELQSFTHPTFPLSGGHANVKCDRCHASPDFSRVAAKCNACHADPKIHAGLFGTDCAVCHTIDAWLPAKLAKHDFPIGHGGEGDIACTTCHVKSYADYTCYNCHAHTDTIEIRNKHVEEGLLEFSDCMQCHADGRTHEKK
jgi:hypothetical protein